MFRLNAKFDKVPLGISYSFIATDVGDKIHGKLKFILELKMDIVRSEVLVHHSTNSKDVSDCIKFNGKGKKKSINMLLPIDTVYEIV